MSSNPNTKWKDGLLKITALVYRNCYSCNWKNIRKKSVITTSFRIIILALKLRNMLHIQIQMTRYKGHKLKLFKPFKFQIALLNLVIFVCVKSTWSCCVIYGANLTFNKIVWLLDWSSFCLNIKLAFLLKLM